jgi:hypothetical protein
MYTSIFWNPYDFTTQIPLFSSLLLIYILQCFWIPRNIVIPTMAVQEMVIWLLRNAVYDKKMMSYNWETTETTALNEINHR